MSSRYPPPRDRSPPRDVLRRPSIPYNPTGSSYRGAGDASQPPVDRAPPRGPKADNFRGSFGFGSTTRGRGSFSSRPSDTWDRERERERDVRPAPSSFRREEDRAEWGRRDREGFPPRDRPAVVDRRDPIRERSASPDRPRRNSRESIPTTYGRQPETTYHGGPLRGQAARSRGRGDYDRGRGRSSFVGERDRDGFFPRSRSREGRREREFDRGRPFPPELDRGDRREYDRLEDRDARARDHDLWVRDRSPGRSSTGRAASPGAMSSHSQHAPQDRHKLDYDIVRKSATIPGPLSARSEGRREPESDYFGARADIARVPLSATFPTPSIPPSASVGLDYGDAPSVPVTPSAPVAKVVLPKSQPIKTDTVSVATVVQPPSGPKADRNAPPPNAPSTPRTTNQPFDQWTRPDAGVRSLRPAQTVSQYSSSTDVVARVPDSPAENRHIGATSLERLPVSNVPSGPRAISVGTFKPRISSGDQPSPAAPPTAPRQPKAIENRQVPNAPTGPRSAGFNAPSGPHGATQTGSSRAWVNPEYRPKPPSIMNQLNKPYQLDVRERQPYTAGSRSAPMYQNQHQQQKPKIMAGLMDSAKSPTKSGHSMGSSSVHDDSKMDGDQEDMQMSLLDSDDEESDALDEDYFADQEKTHATEMDRLEAKKPLPPLQDPVVASLIIRVQLLNMIALGIMPEAYEEAKSSTNDVVPMDLDITNKQTPLSPNQSPSYDVQMEHPRPRGRPLSKPFVNPIPTPPIDDLPYLNHDMYRLRVSEEVNGSTGPTIFDESEEGDRQAFNLLGLEHTFQHQLSQEHGTLELLESYYVKKLPEWRDEVAQLERIARELHQPSPAPASPAPSATPSLPGNAQRAALERTRGARNTTDLDMEQAILMSQQSAREEEERREREAVANALPNYDTEAMVPFMLDLVEIEVENFEDSCEMIPQDYVLEFSAFIPPEDDFDDAEQLAFIQAYCQNPKKWGKIADAIPNRSYQECIAHYYLTKDQASYKEHWRRSQPKRRRGRQAAVKPRANNLMSDLALNEDADGTPVAMTDSGRPRRAAAPTFGDTMDAEVAVPAPAAKRSAGTAKDGSENPVPKATRGRKPGTATRTRKTKDKAPAEQYNSFLAPANTTDASPQKGTAGKDKARTILKAEAPSKAEPFSHHTTPSHLLYDASRMMPVHDTPPVIAAPPAFVVTSYWSVLELNKFKQLVAHFGKDFGEIANFLKTKSSTMIRNHYQREVNGGKTELEYLAEQAEQRKARGDRGPPPSPVQPAKRQREYTATPMSGRPTTSINEQMLPDPDPLHLPAKALIEDFPSNSIQRNATGEVVANPRAPRDNIQLSPAAMQVQPKVEELQRSERSMLGQKPSQGPPRGRFQIEDMPAYQPQHHRAQRQGHEPPSHQQQSFQPVSLMNDYLAQAQQQQQQQIQQQPPPPLPREQRLQPNISTLGRESLAQSPQGQVKAQYQHHSSERSLQASSRGHSRNGSQVTSVPNIERVAADLASLRNADQTRNMMYAAHTAPSPVGIPAQPIHIQRVEPPPVARQQPPRPESVKPAPAKRSNLFGLLNDEPPEPPAKRASTDSAKRSINTPPPVAAHAILQQSRQPEDLGNVRSNQPSYSHSGRIGQDYPAGYSSSPVTGRSKEWLDQFDPRQQSQNHELRSIQQSPAMGSYSLLPPNSQSIQTPGSVGRFDPARNVDQSSLRRSLLGNNHAPSPPSQAATPIQSHRPSSGTSSHQRGTSLAYSQNQATNQPQAAGPLTYPQSTSATPVSSLHHRSQTSIDFSGRRLTIQEHLREQQQRDHEQNPHMRREIEMMPQQQQPVPSQQRREPRDIYSIDQQPVTSGPAPHHMQPPQSSQTPQPQHVGMGYQTQPPRTFTPPHGVYGQTGGPSNSTHSHHQQQYQQQASQQQQQQHNQFGHQHHHSQHQQQQQQQQPPPPQYGGPPSHQGFGGRALGPGQSSGQDSRGGPPPPPQQPQHSQQIQGHYRGYSQDDRR